jgi:hypothetical protein
MENDNFNGIWLTLSLNHFKKKSFPLGKFRSPKTWNLEFITNHKFLKKNITHSSTVLRILKKKRMPFKKRVKIHKYTPTQLEKLPRCLRFLLRIVIKKWLCDGWREVVYIFTQEWMISGQMMLRHAWRRKISKLMASLSQNFGLVCDLQSWCFYTHHRNCLYSRGCELKSFNAK